MPETENSKEYEMSYFLTADVTEGKLDETTNEINSLIAASGGGNITSEAPKRKRLAYPIRKQNESHFGVVYFNISSEGLDKLKKSLALSKKVLRYMVLNKPLKPKSADIAAEPIKSNNEPMPAPAPAQSFDQKLENILNR